MTEPVPRYNAPCRVEGCPSWIRRGDVVCRRHYYLLPTPLRRLLWSDKPHDWILALQWLDDHEA